MFMGLTVILADFLAQTPSPGSKLFELLPVVLELLLLPSLISFWNSKAAILRPGVEAFTMIVLQSMNRNFQMFITRTILGREQHCKTCIWLGVGQTGVVVSNDLVLWIGPITDTKSCRSCCLYFV